MLEFGFSHDALNRMDEDEFASWFDEAVALIEARVEARRQAAEA